MAISENSAEIAPNDTDQLQDQREPLVSSEVMDGASLLKLRTKLSGLNIALTETVEQGEIDTPQS